MTTPSFAVTLIARNAERCLPRLLASLRPFTDRGGIPLVVDTGSRDATVAIARAAGCRTEVVGTRFHSLVSSREARAIDARFARGDEAPLVPAGSPVFDFGAAREEASRCSDRDMIFQPDASDEIVAFDVDFLDAAVREGRSGGLRYRLEYGPWTLEVARFYDRRVSRWEGRVHEAPWPRPGAAARPVPECAAERLFVRHEIEAKARHYLAGLALDALEKPDHPRRAHYFGRELHFLGRHRSAIDVLEGHAAMTHGWAAERSQSLCFIGESQLALGDVEAAASAFARACTTDPARREPWLRLASLAQSRGDLEACATYASKALAIVAAPAYPEATANYAELPHHFLYWALYGLGRREEAREHWAACRRFAPDREPYASDARFFT
jgi:tetratricopeptide repeat protein